MRRQADRVVDRFPQGAVLLACLTLTPGPATMEQHPAQGQPLRAAVDAVRVEMVALDASGQFVSDLTQDDVVVKDNGDQQAIATFALVPGEVLPQHATEAGAPESHCRVALAVLIDDLNVSVHNALRTRGITHRFIDAYTERLDCVSVMLTGSDSEWTAAPADLESAKAVIDGFTGRKSSVEDRDTDMRAALRTLRRVIGSLGASDASRRAVLLVSEGPDFPPRSSHPLARDLKETTEAAAAASVALYPLDPRQLGAHADDVVGFSSSAGAILLPHWDRIILRDLAAYTGGRALVDSGAVDEFFRSLLADMSLYYLLGFYPSDSEKGFHRLEVDVKRDDVRILARRGYRIVQ